MKDLVFDLKLKEVPVTFTMPDGSVKNFKLREATGSQRQEHLSNLANRAEYIEGRKDGIVRDFRGMSENLLGMCMYDESGKLVSPAFLTTIPYSVMKDLYDAAEELSGLNAKAEQETKN